MENNMYNPNMQGGLQAVQAKPKKADFLRAIPDGSVAMVNAKVDFSRVASFILLDERKRDFENLIKYNPRTKMEKRDYTRLDGKQVSIVPTQQNGKTQFELYLEQHEFFTSKKHPEKGLCYKGRNIGNRLPMVYVKTDKVDETGKPVYESVVLAKELAQDLNVTMYLRVFTSKTNPDNKSISMDAIIINEPLRYRENVSDVANKLQEMGITIKNTVPEQAPVANPGGLNDVNINNMVNNHLGNAGQPQVSPQVQPQVQPQVNPQVQPQVQPQVNPQQPVNPYMNMPNGMPNLADLNLNNPGDSEAGIVFNGEQ